MLCIRNQHSVIGQLYFENKLTEKRLGLWVTRGLGEGGECGPAEVLDEGSEKKKPQVKTIILIRASQPVTLPQPT